MQNAICWELPLSNPNEALWCHIATKILGHVGSGNVLWPDNTWSLPEPIWSCHFSLWHSPESNFTRSAHEPIRDLFGDSTFKTRYVDGTSTSEVTPVATRYIHPPHYGYPKGIVMDMHNQLTSLSFHVNQLSHSRNKAIPNFELEKFKVKIMGMVKRQDHTVSPVSNLFAFSSFQIGQRHGKVIQYIFPHLYFLSQISMM